MAATVDCWEDEDLAGLAEEVDCWGFNGAPCAGNLHLVNLRETLKLRYFIPDNQLSRRCGSRSLT